MSRRGELSVEEAFELLWSEVQEGSRKIRACGWEEVVQDREKVAVVEDRKLSLGEDCRKALEGATSVDDLAEHLFNKGEMIRKQSSADLRVEVVEWIVPKEPVWCEVEGAVVKEEKL